MTRMLDEKKSDTKIGMSRWNPITYKIRRRAFVAISRFILILLARAARIGSRVFYAPFGQDRS